MKKSVAYGNVISQDLTSDDYSWDTRISNKIKIKPVDFQINFFYRAPQQSAQGLRKAFYMLNTAASVDVFKGKGTLTFNVRERSYSITLNYRLNQKKKMGRERGQNGGNDNYGGDDMSF